MLLIAAALAMATGSSAAGDGSVLSTVLTPAIADVENTTSKDTTYCVRTFVTGSRIPQKICQTRKAWMAQGFDPLAPLD